MPEKQIPHNLVALASEIRNLRARALLQTRFESAGQVVIDGFHLTVYPPHGFEDIFEGMEVRYQITSVAVLPIVAIPSREGLYGVLVNPCETGITAPPPLGFTIRTYRII